MTGHLSEDEVKLWRTVVLQALMDAASLQIASTYPSWPKWLIKKTRDEARHWFTQADKDFQEVCSMANLDDATVKQFALKLIRGDGYSKRLLLEWKNATRTKKEEDINERTNT